MNKRNGKGSAWRRVLRRIRRSRIADVLSIVIITAGILLLFLPLIPGDGKREDAQETQDAEPLVIEIPDPCTSGTVTVYSGSELVYEYSGEIMIRNDGNNGEEIEVQIQYPDGTWPCSCMDE